MPGDDKLLTNESGRMKSEIPEAPNAWDVEDQTALFKGSGQVANVILLTTHSLALLPLFLIVLLQDVHLKLVAVLNTTLMLLISVGNFAFYRLRVVKVYPKLLDTFLLVFYASMIPVVYLEYSWLLYWICVYHHAVVAAFIWLSILLPIWDNFALELLKDYLPEQLWQSQAAQRTSLRVSQVWAAALTIMALVALVPTLTGQNNVLGPIHVVCNYVLGLVPLLVATAAHCWLFKLAVRAARQDDEHQDAHAGVSVTMATAFQHGRSSLSTAVSPFSQARLARDDHHMTTSSSGSSSGNNSGFHSDISHAKPDKADGVAAQLGQLLRGKRAANAVNDDATAAATHSDPVAVQE